jgi:hypothetical protein
LEKQTMWKTLLAGTAAAAIAGSTIVYAQQRSDAPAQDTHVQDTTAQAQQDHGDQSGPRADRERSRARLSREDRAAFMEARMAGRLAALKAGLQLTPDQDKLWPAYESAVRDMIKLHRDHMAAARPQANGSQANGAGDNSTAADRTSDEATARMLRRAQALTEGGAALKRLADARGPLFSSFDEGQKRRFAMLSRMGRFGAGGMREGRREMGRQMGRNGGEGFRQERRAEHGGNRWQRRSGAQGEERGWQGREGNASRDDGRAEERNGRRGERAFRGRDEDGRAARGEFRRGERGGRDQYRQDRYRNDDGTNGRRGGDRDFRRGDRGNSGAGQRPEEDADHSSPETGGGSGEHL